MDHTYFYARYKISDGFKDTDARRVVVFYTQDALNDWYSKNKDHQVITAVGEAYFNKRGILEYDTEHEQKFNDEEY